MQYKNLFQQEQQIDIQITNSYTIFTEMKRTNN